MTRKPKPHPAIERAWAAGFFDAKVSFPKSGYVLDFDSFDHLMVKRFGETVGVGKVKNVGIIGRAVQETWRWETYNMDDSRTVLLFVLPLLSPHKRKLAMDMLAKIERSPRWLKEHPEVETITKSSEPTAPSADEKTP